MPLAWNCPSLTDSEAQICKFVKSCPRLVINLSLEELSQKCFVSQATIIRMCKKLNCKGFADFKIKLAAELSSIATDDKSILRDLPLEKDFKTDDIMKNFYNLSQESLEDAFVSIDPNHLLKAAQLLARADKIELYGRGTSLLIAEDFHYKLLRLGLPSSLESLNGFQEVTNMQPRQKGTAAAVVVSQYCNSQQVHYIIDELASSKVPFIIVTTAENIFPYDKLASFVFKLRSGESRQKIGSFASRIAMQYFLDCLYGQLFTLHYDKNMKQLQQYAKRKAECKYYYRKK